MQLLEGHVYPLVAAAVSKAGRMARHLFLPEVENRRWRFHFWHAAVILRIPLCQAHVRRDSLRDSFTCLEAWEQVVAPNVSGLCGKNPGKQCHTRLVEEKKGGKKHENLPCFCELHSRTNAHTNNCSTHRKIAK